MENGQKTILSLFNGDKHFIIPKYQRAYAWEEKQLQDFIEDIKNQRVDKDYFIGTILFQDEGVRKGFEHIQVVDGQQRLTTTIIFLKVLLNELQRRDKENDYQRDIRKYLKDETFYKLELIQMDNDFFKTHIMDDNVVDDKFIETPSQKRLLNAKRYFEKELSGLPVSELKEIKDKIERTKLLTYSVNDTAEATLIFETTNDRGKSLTNLEKTKSFLMHKIYLTKDKPDELLNSIHDRFSAIYRIFEEIEYNIDEDSILQYHFISHFDWKYTQKNKDYNQYVEKFKEKINLMLKSDQSKDVPEFINNYSTKLKETFNVIKQILADNNPFIQDLFVLERMSLFYPLLISCYKYDSSEDKKTFYEIAQLLEIFSFRVYGVGRKPSYTGRDKLYSMARDFKGDFDSLKMELASNILEYVNDKKFEDMLLSDDVYDDLKDEIKYILWKYENHLRIPGGYYSMTTHEFKCNDERKKLTLEHVAPQTPKEMKVTTEHCKFPEYTEEFKEKFLHCLGNLTFDPRSANASKGNKSVEEKNSKYFVKAPYMTQNELDEFIEKDTGSWSVTSIINRRLKIIKFAQQYWNPHNIVKGDIVPASDEEETEKSDSALSVRNIIESLTENLEQNQLTWASSFSVISKEGFKTYQSRDGYETSTHIRWELDKGFELWMGIIEDEETHQFEFYSLIKSRRKSELLANKFEKKEIKKFLELQGYENESGAAEKPSFVKYVPINNLHHDFIFELSLNEFGKLKEIIDKIMRD